MIQIMRFCGYGLISLLLCGCSSLEVNKHTNRFSYSARVELGLAYLQQGNRPKAYANLTLAKQQNPNHVQTLLALAYYYQTVNDDTNTRRIYQKALKIAPKNGDILNNWGAYLCSQGAYQQADAFFNQALQQNQYVNISSSYENAGICALQNQQSSQARHYFIQAINHNPYQAESVLQLIQLDIDEGDSAAAQTRLRMAKEQFAPLPRLKQLATQIVQEK